MRERKIESGFLLVLGMHNKLFFIFAKPICCFHVFLWKVLQKTKVIEKFIEKYCPIFNLSKHICFTAFLSWQTKSTVCAFISFPEFLPSSTSSNSPPCSMASAIALHVMAFHSSLSWLALGWPILYQLRCIVLLKSVCFLLLTKLGFSYWTGWYCLITPALISAEVASLFLSLPLATLCNSFTQHIILITCFSEHSETFPCLSQ